MDNKLLLEIAALIVIILVARGIYKTSKTLLVGIALTGRAMYYMQGNSDFIQGFWNNVN